MALLAWSECASSEAEIRLENRQLDDDGGNQTGRDSERQKTNGQRNMCGPKDNNLQILSTVTYSTTDSKKNAIGAAMSQSQTSSQQTTYVERLSKDRIGGSQEMEAGTGMVEMGNTAGIREEERNNTVKSGRNELEVGPSASANIELKGRGSHVAPHAEERDRSAMGFANDTNVESHIKQNNDIGPKTNGLVWKVYSRHTWCRKQKDNSNVVAPEYGKEDGINSVKISQPIDESGQFETSPLYRRAVD